MEMIVWFVIGVAAALGVLMLVAIYVTNRGSISLKNTQVPSRPKAPILLFLDYEIAHSDMQEAIEDAVYFINSAAGLPLLDFMDEQKIQAGIIVPVVNHPTGDRPIHVSVSPEGSVEAILVDLEIVAEDDYLVKKFLCAHALGHALGLDDSDFLSSFMFYGDPPAELIMTTQDQYQLRSIHAPGTGGVRAAASED